MQQSGVWLGALWWAAGPWWGDVSTRCFSVRREREADDVPAAVLPVHRAALWPGGVRDPPAGPAAVRVKQTVATRPLYPPRLKKYDVVF